MDFPNLFGIQNEFVVYYFSETFTHTVKMRTEGAENVCPDKYSETNF